MRNNPFGNQAAKDERILNKLERELEKDTAYLRRFRERMSDIDRLLVNGRIDKGHAQILRCEAEKVYNAERAKALEPQRKARAEEEAKTMQGYAYVIAMGLFAFFCIILEYMFG